MRKNSGMAQGNRKKEKKELLKKIILGVMFAFVIMLGIYSNYIGSQWQYDSIALFVLVLILALLYKKLNMTVPALLTAFLAISLHSFGVFGLYAGAPLGIDYDHYTHFASGIALGLMIYHYLERYHSNMDYASIHKPAVIIITLFLVSGLGNIVEVTEYAGYRFFGPGEGMFFFGYGDGVVSAENVPGEWDNSMKDTIFNFLGGLFAVILMQFDFLWKKALEKRR